MTIFLAFLNEPLIGSTSWWSLWKSTLLYFNKGGYFLTPFFLVFRRFDRDRSRDFLDMLFLESDLLVTESLEFTASRFLIESLDPVGDRLPIFLPIERLLLFEMLGILRFAGLILPCSFGIIQLWPADAAFGF